MLDIVHANARNSKKAIARLSKEVAEFNLSQKMGSYNPKMAELKSAARSVPIIISGKIKTDLVFWLRTLQPICNELVISFGAKFKLSPGNPDHKITKSKTMLLGTGVPFQN